MIVSVCEEMNPIRRNTMEDVHVVNEPGSWGSPNNCATFLGKYIKSTYLLIILLLFGVEYNGYVITYY